MNQSVEMGHNERTSRLGLLADDARGALVRVASGEADAQAGWLAYGAALNEGRGLFERNPRGDAAFGEWVVASQLATLDGRDILRDDRAAAMWAARDSADFQAAQDASNARTVRGIHAKWLEMDAARKAAEERARADAERARAAEERRKADIERHKAEQSRLAAAKERAEAQARIAAEEAAARAEQRAKDDAERKAAQARRAVELKARLEAEAKAKAAEETAAFSEAIAKASEVLAVKSDKTAKQAEKKAVTEEKRAARVASGTVGNVAHVANNSGENEWYTPAPFVEAARAVMGGFDLDPATSELANKTVKADLYFTAQDDGLKQPWPIGRVWMNPPYAQPLMGQFAEKFAAEMRNGSQGIVLVNNATETAWFQTIAAECSAICFPKTRIKFVDPDGNASGAPLQGQAIIYCGPDVDAFKESFGVFGLVVSHG